MWLILVATVILSLGLSGSGFVGWNNMHKAPEQLTIQQTTAKYRTFVFLMAQYMERGNPTRPAAGQIKRIEWKDAVSSAYIPPGARKTSMPDNWYAEMNSAGEFVICAQIDERSVNMLGALMPKETSIYQFNQDDKLKSIFADNQGEADTIGAQWCK